MKIAALLFCILDRELRRADQNHFDLQRRALDEHLEELQRDLNSVYAE